jgi:hypothetical protein
MAALTVQSLSVNGVVPSYDSAAGGGDTFVNNGDTFFHAKNGSGSPITITFATAGTVAQGVAISDVAVVVAAGAEKMVGPFDQTVFNGSSGVSVTYSDVTSLTVAAIKLR